MPKHDNKRQEATNGSLPLAGKPAPAWLLIDVAALEAAYETRKPDMSDPAQRVAFGTSGNRGTPSAASFTAPHSDDPGPLRRPPAHQP